MTFDTNFNVAFDSPTQDIDPTTALLIRARGFIERGWCRYVRARDAAGNPVEPTSEQAVAWCAGGALIAAGSPDDERYRRAEFRRLEDAIDCSWVANFNDLQETVEPILAAFDRAIAARETT
jgi:hypothetical protein